MTEHTIVHIPQIEAVVLASLSEPSSQTTETIENSPTTDLKEWHFWGVNDSYPNEVYEQCSTNSIIPSTINWKSRTLRSGGVRYGIISGYKPDGTEIFEPIEHSEIEEFLEHNDIELYFEEALSDLIWFAHAYAELGIQKDRKKISSIVAQEATFCRLAKQDKTTGKISKVYIDANFKSKKTASKVKSVALVNPYWDPVGNTRKGKEDKVIYPISIGSPGKVYYQVPDWHSILNDNWLDVANQIPKFKSYLMKNQMSIKYVIHVPESWWEWKYPGFNSSNKYSKEERQKIMKEEMTRFNNLITGVENTGKSIVLTFKSDVNKNEYTKWEIKALESGKNSGEYMEESQEASSHILYALGVDGTLIGSTPGKSIGAGSGSDKRVAWNIFIINNKPLQDKLLKPLDFITKYNNWKSDTGKKIVWRFNNYLIATLDTGTSIQPASK
jgi:hypothetical protein